MRKTQEKEIILITERVGSKEYKEIVDKETGEILNSFWNGRTNGPFEKKVNEGGHFFKLYKTNLIQIVTEKAKEKRLELDEAGLLFMLVALLGWQTPYLINPNTNRMMSCSEIADFFGRDRANIHKLLERLISKGLVSKVVNGNGRSNYYMLNPNLIFNGKTIDDLKHLDIFKNCPYEPKKYINYRKTPEKKK